MSAHAIPEGHFAVVRDTERRIIVESGTYGACVDRAAALNLAYQSTAYVAEPWRRPNE